MNYTLLFYLVLALQVADIMTTYVGLSRGSGISEWSPIAAALQKVLPGKWTWLIVLKLLGMIGLIYGNHKYGPEMTGPLVLLAIFYTWVVAHNCTVISKQK